MRCLQKRSETADERQLQKSLSALPVVAARRRHTGDRSSPCGGVMDAIALRRVAKGMQIVHRCARCGMQRPNRVADRGDQPDDVDALIHLMHL